MQLSVVIITFNEEANIGRTLESVKALVSDGKGEIIIVDSGSTDRTVEIAKSYGAKIFVEEWKGFAAQKNSAIDKAGGRWILSLDADEEVEPELATEINARFPSARPTQPELLALAKQSRYLVTRESLREFKKRANKKRMDEGDLFATITGLRIPRKNKFLGRWIRHGGFWPDPKLRLFRKGMARFEERPVHEDLRLIEGISGRLRCALIHHSYPTISEYIEHMNRYSSLGAEMVAAKGNVRFNFLNIAARPLLTFFYNYFLRLGFLDGKEGLLLHVNHAVYVSWKYAKAYELSRRDAS